MDIIHCSEYPESEWGSQKKKALGYKYKTKVVVGTVAICFARHNTKPLHRQI